ncbi:MAG TPA: FMN reductase [Candidatus Limnocylindrales bacterium]|nr:FMN reductase [Candidatus Limnocylindrales bacterium]
MNIRETGIDEQGRLRLVTVSAGLGQPSSTRLLADRLAIATERELTSARREVVHETIELRGHAQELVSNLLTGFPPADLRHVVEATRAADGLIAVTPIFNASYSGLFKLFFDVLERDSLAGLPVLIAATGGTRRHSLALDYAVRPLFAYLGAAVVPTAVFAAAEDWGAAPTDNAAGALVERIDRAAGELAGAILAGPRRRTRDPFADPVPFADLVRGSRAEDGAGSDETAD